MLRIAVVHPGRTGPLYSAAAARTRGVFELTHVMGDAAIARSICLQSTHDLLRRNAEFDACVVHEVAGCLDQLIALAAAGKHLLIHDATCDVGTWDRLHEVAIDSSIRLTAMQPRRFTPYATAIHGGLDAGHLGHPGLVRIHRWDRACSSESAQARLWRMCLGEVDLACGLFQSGPQTVFGQSIGDSASGPAKGLLMHLGFENGMALIDCALHQADPFYTVSVVGARGAAYADDHHNTNLVMREGTRGVNTLNDHDWLRLQLEAFAHSVASPAVDNSVEQIKLAITTAHAAVQSAASDQRVAERVGARYELR